MNLYYYTLDEDGLNTTKEYFNWAEENYYFMNFRDYKNWTNCINNLDYNLNENEFIINNISQIKEKKMFAIIVRDDINLTTNVKSLTIKNDAKDDINVCINENCKLINKDKTEKFESFI